MAERLTRAERRRIASFVRERDAMLRALDVDQALAFYRKNNPGRPPPTREVMEIGIHKARVECMSLTDAERAASADWLVEQGYHPGITPAPRSALSPE